MNAHPYRSLPDHAFWRRAVGQVLPSEINPVVAVPFPLTSDDQIVTAGSCFAQHIGARLQANNFKFLVTEKAHPIASPAVADQFNYGIFSARYGNIYTARQLLQLFNRVYHRFAPREDVWKSEDGRFIDPFRPQIQPGGFLTTREYELDREQHFAAVRQAFEQLDVFVFTLGLTEAWCSAEDGAVYPLCPGVAGGNYDADKYHFQNFNISEVVEDLLSFIDSLRLMNPISRIVLTVSPVPLVATARPDTHVLAATVYSKSVLRVAAEMVAQQRSNVAYFPAYEIIIGRFDAGTYFTEDRRSVTEAGVAHVMRVFFRCFTNVSSDPASAEPLAEAPEAADLREMEELVKIHCDEVALDRP